MLLVSPVAPMAFEPPPDTVAQPRSTDDVKEVAMALPSGAQFLLTERTRRGAYPKLYGAYRLLDFTLTDGRLTWKVESASDGILVERTGVMILHNDLLTMVPSMPLTCHKTDQGLAPVFKFYLPRDCMVHHFDYLMARFPKLFRTDKQ